MYGPRRGYVGGPGAPDAPEADPLSFDELYSPLSEPYLPLRTNPHVAWLVGYSHKCPTADAYLARAAVSPLAGGGERAQVLGDGQVACSVCSGRLASGSGAGAG